MILATDVHYKEDHTATAAGLLFSDWQLPQFNRVIVKEFKKVKPYVSGSFFRRELPCIMGLLNEVKESLEIIVIDGYVVLGGNCAPGLGARLHQEIHQAVPVIGVAKERYAGTPETCAVYRGASKKPLFITSVGIPLPVAKQHIKSMYGPTRIPLLLKKVDQICRGLTMNP